MMAILMTIIKINQNTAPGMPNNWRWGDIEKTVAIIEKEKPGDFNVAQLISGDTRANDVRAILTTRERVPMKVDEYDKAKVLYVIRSTDTEEAKMRVWEIDAMGTTNIEWKKNINNQVELIKLVK
jgi:hypothetical protein